MFAVIPALLVVSCLPSGERASVVPGVADGARLEVDGQPAATAEAWVEAIPFRLIFPSADRYVMLSGEVTRFAGAGSSSKGERTARVAGTWRELNGERTFDLSVSPGGTNGALAHDFLDDRRIIGARYQVARAGIDEGLVVTVYTVGLTYEFIASVAEWELDELLDIARDIATVWEEANEG